VGVRVACSQNDLVNPSKMEVVFIDRKILYK
jgi:hypothetical protein